MDIKGLLKNAVAEKNPFAIRRRNNMRQALINTNPTFLCPNCIGGILFHDLKLQFRSPTVNLMMYQTDFFKFVMDLDHYLGQELRFFRHSEYACPCAYLDDIVIHFTHYSSEESAKAKWLERVKRIDRDNLFIFIMERDGITGDCIRQLGNLSVRGIVAFTYNDYPDIPYAVKIDKYASDGEVGNVLRKNYLNDSHEYEQYFDFVKWFNNANGGNYDVTPYRK